MHCIIRSNWHVAVILLTLYLLFLGNKNYFHEEKSYNFDQSCLLLSEYSSSENCTLAEPKDSKFTIVINVYQRVPFLKRALREYVKCNRLAKIVVVWHNDSESPNLPLHYAVNPLIKYTVVPNLLSYNYVPHELIKTDGVFLIDEDLYVACCALDTAFKLWLQNPHRMVGFAGRRVLVNGSDTDEGHGSATNEGQEGIKNAVWSSKGTFIHRQYLSAWNSSFWQSELAEMDRGFLPVQDILLSAVHAHSSKLAPLVLYLDKDLYHVGNPLIQLGRLTDFYAKRRAFQRRVLEKLGYNPFAMTETYTHCFIGHVGDLPKNILL